MRADEAAPGGLVAGAAGAERLAEALHVARAFAFEGEGGGREGTVGLGGAGGGGEAGEGEGAVGPEAGARGGHARLEGVEPRRVADAVADQAVALAQGAVVGAGDLAVVGDEAEGHPVEEAPALGGALEPQAVHGGGDPQDAGDGAEGGLAGGLAVDLDAAPGALAPGGGLVGAVGGVDPGGDLPADGLGAAGEFLAGCAAQAAAGGEERDGLDQVGLAGAVRAEDRDRTAVEVQPRAAMRAEMGEGEPGDREQVRPASASRRRPPTCRCPRASASDRRPS